MDEIVLYEVTRENWRAALELTVQPEQQRFVAEHLPIAAIAIAKAYIRPGGLVWIPFAFYRSGSMIGFAELACEPGSLQNYWLFHFFLDQRYQGMGYGKQAVDVFVRMVRERYPECEALQLTVHPENVRAQKLYTRAGFQATGMEVGDEPVYKLFFQAREENW